MISTGSRLAQGERHSLSEIKQVFLPSFLPLTYLILAITGRLRRLLATKGGTVSVVHLLAGEDAARKKTKKPYQCT